MSHYLEYFHSTSLLLIFIGICLCSAVFFTGAETALISSDRSRLRKLQKEGNRYAATALQLLSNIENLLTTTQFGACLAISSATTFATILSIVNSGSEQDWRVFLFLTPAILFFCDTFPKIVARNYSEKIAMLAATPLLFISRIFSPITGLLSFYTRRLSSLFGAGTTDAIQLRKRVRKQILSLLSDKGTIAGIKVTQKRMIRNILNFSHQPVRKAMIPLVNVDAIAHDSSAEEAVNLFETLRHSRIPVYSERIDNIIGVLHFMDLFACEDLKKTVREFMRPVMFVPEHQQLEALIVDMSSRDEAMSVVVDEYGGAIGIITKEDVLEEVVGNLSDEFDESTMSVHQITENSYLTNVNVEISEINERLGISLPKGDYETLAGFLLQQFNRIPSVGDELFFSDLKFLVYRASERAIHSVIITKFKKNRPLSK